MSIELCRFFGSPLDAQLLAVRDKVQYDTNYALLAGPPQSCKTSLLFQYACSYAQESREVIFICSKKKIQHTLPMFLSGVQPSSSVLQRIKMKYIDDDKTLRSYMAKIHLLTQQPELIIVDDLSTFFSAYHGNDRPGLMAKTLAFLKEATDYSSTVLQRTQPHSRCCLLISELTGIDCVPRPQILLQRWLPLLITIQGKQKSFTMSVLQFNHQSDPLKVNASFVLNSQSFRLHTLEFSQSSGASAQSNNHNDTMDDTAS